MKLDKKTARLSFDSFEEEELKKGIYFIDYLKSDGDWIEKGEPICRFNYGKLKGFMIEGFMLKAIESGYLQTLHNKNDEIKQNDIIYILHDENNYENQNSIHNFEFKENFYCLNKRYSFGEWLVNDGDYVTKNTPIFEFKDSQFNEIINYSKKEGFVDLVDPAKVVHLSDKELMYFIRDSDRMRIEQKYINSPKIIKDDFSKSILIKWNRVSSKKLKTECIKTKCDDSLIDFCFTFNYLIDNDTIVFYFNPKQIRPKQFDKIFFLFENGEQIAIELTENPNTSKSLINNKVLESLNIITKNELELFAKSNLKKWKISLFGDTKEILGGEIGNDVFYPNKNNLQIVIRKLATEYISLVKKTIPDYKPTELKQNLENNINKTDNCFVYLMHDTSNNYHKIGISNSPKYREKTLQSEKPTIEMIASKNFPNRKIAESIEKALHNTYSEKRLRGEWFDLDIDEIKDIEQTLN